jgi:hypothetical protein
MTATRMTLSTLVLCILPAATATAQTGDIRTGAIPPVNEKAVTTTAVGQTKKPSRAAGSVSDRSRHGDDERSPQDRGRNLEYEARAASQVARTQQAGRPRYLLSRFGPSRASGIGAGEDQRPVAIVAGLRVRGLRRPEAGQGLEPAGSALLPARIGHAGSSGGRRVVREDAPGRAEAGRRPPSRRLRGGPLPRERRLDQAHAATLIRSAAPLVRSRLVPVRTIRSPVLATVAACTRSPPRAGGRCPERMTRLGVSSHASAAPEP